MLLDVKEKLRHTEDAVDVVVYAVSVNKRQIKTQHCINRRNTDRLARARARALARVAVTVYPYCIITMTREWLIQERDDLITDANIVMLGNNLADARVLCIFDIGILMRGEFADDGFA